VSGKVQAVSIFHRSPLQIELVCRSPAGMMIPSVGEQNAADIHK
jgi:hypothetical protein